MDKTQVVHLKSYSVTDILSWLTHSRNGFAVFFKGLCCFIKHETVLLLVSKETSSSLLCKRRRDIRVDKNDRNETFFLCSSSWYENMTWRDEKQLWHLQTGEDHESIKTWEKQESVDVTTSGSQFRPQSRVKHENECLLYQVVKLHADTGSSRATTTLLQK